MEITPTMVTKICKIIQQDLKKYLPLVSTKEDLKESQPKESKFGLKKDKSEMIDFEMVDYVKQDDLRLIKYKIEKIQSDFDFHKK